MSSFKVGEVATLRLDLGTTPPHLLKYSGEDCTIIEPFGVHPVVTTPEDPSRTVTGYVIQMPDNFHLVVEPHELIKKKPPAREIDTVVKWEDCAWRPKIKELEAA